MPDAQRVLGLSGLIQRRLEHLSVSLRTNGRTLDVKSLGKSIKLFIVEFLCCIH